MYKFANDMEKVAFYTGKANAYFSAGFSESMVKQAFMSEGVSSEDAEVLVKMAGWGSLMTGAAKGIGRMAGKWGGKAIGAGAKRGGRMGEAMQWGGKQIIGGGKALGQAAKGMGASPIKTLGRGAVEAGKGALFAGGKGVGGAIGKGAFGASMYSMLKGPGQAQAPQAYGGSMMRQPQQGYR